MKKLENISCRCTKETITQDMQKKQKKNKQDRHSTMNTNTNPCS